LIVVLIAVINIMCFNTMKPATAKTLNAFDPNHFTGAQACRSCHTAIFDAQKMTAHYLSSAPGAREYIKGNLDSGKNSYQYNQWMQVRLENNSDEIFQTAYINGLEMQSYPIGIVIGSARKGQTYLYWKDGLLFQLPVSYYTPLDSWCNSPGYSKAVIRFDREIQGQCMECHSTYAQTETQDVHTFFDKDKIIYGIGCERCHGPGAAHVAFQQTHPKDTTAQFIINPSKLSRHQRLDNCALCHSGLRTQTKPSFSFMVGDKLADFSEETYNTDTSSLLDVHGNQYGLLTSSKCFRMSTKMDCSSCHDVHQSQLNMPEMFSQKCMSCHNANTHITCRMPETKGLVLSNNCIDCHMPSLQSKKIFLDVANPKNSTAELVRTHHIGIYLQQTKEFVEKLKPK
jgi:hypothetical protein